MPILPKARTENIVVQDLKNETLIYDLITNKAFNLNQTLSIVFNACDGIMTFAELKRKYKFADDFIHLALDELKSENLLAENHQSPFAGINRRDVIKKVGFASLFVLPLISGLVAPQAIQAASAIDNNDFYNRGYLEYCRDGGPFCAYRGGDDGYRCLNNTCCVVTAQGSLLPGATFDAGDGAYTVYQPVDGSCANPPDICSGSGCCSGNAVQTENCEPTTFYDDETGKVSTCIIFSCECACL